MNKIPIMFCFDNNYVIPAAACFNSILTNCDKTKKYSFFILHTDITNNNQKKLKYEIDRFKDIKVEVNFINMQNKFNDIFDSLKYKNHFSKEMFYKLICTSIFVDLDKIIVTDVDVIFEGDISKMYYELDKNDDYYIAGIPSIHLKNKKFNSLYVNYPEEDRKKLIEGVGAGFLLLNLHKMRENNCEEMFLEYTKKNLKKLTQPEQDVLNIVCYNHIKKLPYYYMVCSFTYTDFKNEQAFKNLKNESDIDKVKYALENPIQLHYATYVKPWKYVDSEKSEVFFKYLFQTEFAKEYLEQLPRNIKSINISKFKKIKKKIIYILYRIYHFIRHFLRLED